MIKYEVGDLVRNLLIEDSLGIVLEAGLYPLYKEGSKKDPRHRLAKVQWLRLGVYSTQQTSLDFYYELEKII